MYSCSEETWQIACPGNKVILNEAINDKSFDRNYS